MSAKRTLLDLVLVVLTVGGWGCRPYIVGSDAGVYSGGKLYAVVSRDLASVYAATLEAVGELELEVTEKAKDVFSANVVAEGADGRIIRVRIRPRQGDVSELRIRVGPFGDRHRSIIVYERIQEKLAYTRETPLLGGSGK